MWAQLSPRHHFPLPLTLCKLIKLIYLMWSSPAASQTSSRVSPVLPVTGPAWATSNFGGAEIEYETFFKCNSFKIKYYTRMYVIFMLLLLYKHSKYLIIWVHELHVVKVFFSDVCFLEWQFEFNDCWFFWMMQKNALCFTNFFFFFFFEIQ